MGNTKGLESVDVGAVGDSAWIEDMPLAVALEKDHLDSIEVEEGYRGTGPAEWRIKLTALHLS